MPLSHPSKRVLAFGAEEAQRLKQEHIGTRHLAIGLFREDDPIAAHLLKSRGVDLETLREAAATESPVETGSERAKSMDLLRQMMERRSAFDFKREGDLKNGRFTTTDAREGVRTVRSINYVHGHEIRVIERMQVSEDGKSLRYTVEIQGPGQDHRHEIDFPVG